MGNTTSRLSFQILKIKPNTQSHYLNLLPFLHFITHINNSAVSSIGDITKLKNCENDLNLTIIDVRSNRPFSVVFKPGPLGMSVKLHVGLPFLHNLQITGIEKDSVAEKAGLVVNDWILGIENVYLTDCEDLFRCVYRGHSVLCVFNAEKRTVRRVEVKGGELGLEIGKGLLYEMEDCETKMEFGENVGEFVENCKDSVDKKNDNVENKVLDVVKNDFKDVKDDKLENVIENDSKGENVQLFEQKGNDSKDEKDKQLETDKKVGNKIEEKDDKPNNDNINKKDLMGDKFFRHKLTPDITTIPRPCNTPKIKSEANKLSGEMFTDHRFLFNAMNKRKNKENKNEEEIKSVISAVKKDGNGMKGECVKCVDNNVKVGLDGSKNLKNYYKLNREKFSGRSDKNDSKNVDANENIKDIQENVEEKRESNFIEINNDSQFNKSSNIVGTNIKKFLSFFSSDKEQVIKVENKNEEANKKEENEIRKDDKLEISNDCGNEIENKFNNLIINNNANVSITTRSENTNEVVGVNKTVVKEFDSDANLLNNKNITTEPANAFTDDNLELVECLEDNNEQVQFDKISEGKIKEVDFYGLQTESVKESCIADDVFYIKKDENSEPEKTNTKANVNFDNLIDNILHQNYVPDDKKESMINIVDPEDSFELEKISNYFAYTDDNSFEELFVPEENVNNNKSVSYDNKGDENANISNVPPENFENNILHDDNLNNDANLNDDEIVNDNLDSVDFLSVNNEVKQIFNELDDANDFELEPEIEDETSWLTRQRSYSDDALNRSNEEEFKSGVKSDPGCDE